MKTQEEHFEIWWELNKIQTISDWMPAILIESYKEYARNAFMAGFDAAEETCYMSGVSDGQYYATGGF